MQALNDCFDQNQKTVDSFVKEFNARTTNGLQALAEASDIIIAILPTGKDVRQILVGDDSNEENLISGLDNSKLFIDMSSSEPEGTLELGKIMDDKNIPFLDAPVSGGVKRAVSGSISIMVGGEKHIIARAKPIFEAVSCDVFECGPLGAGHATKAMNNMLSALSVIATTEALLIGQRFGLDPSTLTDVLNKSSGRNNATELKMHQFILKENWKSGFSSGLMLKDLTIAQNLARNAGLSAPCTSLVRDAFAETVNHYGPDSDHTMVANLLQDPRKPKL